MPDDLDQLAYQLRRPLAAYFPAFAASLDLGRGTAMPTTGHDGAAVQAGARFWRTDLGFETYYDGTRWLTVHEYQADFQPYARNAQPWAGAAAVLLLAPMRTDRSIVFLRGKVYMDIVAPNTGANFWSLALKDAGGTTIWAFNTSADAPGVGINKETTTAAIIAPTNYLTYEVTGKTGAPGTIVLNGTFWYRIEVT